MKITSTNQCKDYDKKFVLLDTMNTKHLEKCSQILPADKRNLQLHSVDYIDSVGVPNFTSLAEFLKRYCCLHQQAFFVLYKSIN